MKKTIGGIAGWLMGRLERGVRRQPRLELLERLTLAPKQSLALVTADGQRILVATSAEGSPAIYRLDGGNRFDVKIPVLGEIPAPPEKTSCC
jgi:flagellar biogenesis protein FliO